MVFYHPIQKLRLRLIHRVSLFCVLMFNQRDFQSDQQILITIDMRKTNLIFFVHIFPQQKYNHHLNDYKNFRLSFQNYSFL